VKQSLSCNNACFSVVMNLLTLTVSAYPVACSCPALSTGGYCPHPNDCEKFIQCHWHQEIEHTCPLNTIWYQNLRTCGHGFKAYGCKWSLFIHSFIHSYSASMCFSYIFHIFVLIMKRKFKQWWSTFPPISTQLTNTSDLTSLNIKQNTTYDVGNIGPDMGQA
jgi:hypothetical protein